MTFKPVKKVVSDFKPVTKVEEVEEKEGTVSSRHMASAMDDALAFDPNTLITVPSRDNEITRGVVNQFSDPRVGGATAGTTRPPRRESNPVPLGYEPRGVPTGGVFTASTG